MDNSVISSLLALVGSLLGTFAGILTGGKLTEYRIKMLEQKVEKHNNLIERMYALEEKTQVQEEKLKVANHRIGDLEERLK
ncbi:MAG: hypothetical protein VZR73_03885 [Acutalibacteraceae bacterium]|nr:hypothetical protein [Clostridia bacterium]MEE3403205.1 hypothetical protein [Acutalibacteraceae bacterium]HCA54000.1 hypothetical protein [Oscillospiraceae bacterium]